MKKMLRVKSRNFRNFFFRNNLVFHNSQVFLPQQYNFPQFASFSSSNLQTKGSNGCSTLNSPYFNSSLGLVLLQRGQTDPIFIQVVQIPPYPLFFPVYQIFGKTPQPPFIKYLGKFQTTCLFPPSCLLEPLEYEFWQNFVFTYLYPPENRK